MSSMNLFELLSAIRRDLGPDAGPAVNGVLDTVDAVTSLRADHPDLRVRVLLAAQLPSCHSGVLHGPCYIIPSLGCLIHNARSGSVNVEHWTPRRGT